MINNLKNFRDYLTKHKFILITIFFVFMMIDMIIAPYNISDMIIFGGLFLWFFIVWFSRTEDYFSILFGLILIFITPWFTISGFSGIAEKLSNWAFFFLLFGVLQRMLSLNKWKIKMRKRDNQFVYFKNLKK
jgi:hypothetical protein